MSSYNDLLAKFRDEDSDQIARDFAKIMAMPEGRRLLMWCLGKGGVFRFSRPDDNLNYVAGCRDLALEFMTNANRYAPEEAHLAQKERNDLINERNRRLAEAQHADAKARQER